MERINTKATEKTKKIILDKTKAAQEAKDQENGEKFLQFVGTLSLYPYVFMLLWNWIMPMFGLPPIGFLQSLGLLIMSRLLIKW